MICLVRHIKPNYSEENPWRNPLFWLIKFWNYSFCDSPLSQSLFNQKHIVIFNSYPHISRQELTRTITYFTGYFKLPWEFLYASADRHWSLFSSINRYRKNISTCDKTKVVKWILDSYAFQSKLMTYYHTHKFCFPKCKYMSLQGEKHIIRFSQVDKNLCLFSDILSLQQNSHKILGILFH